MTRLDHLQILRRLLDAGIDFIVIGGFAAELRGAELVANDVDVCASLDAENLRRIADALKPIGGKYEFQPGQYFRARTDRGVLDVHGAVKGVGEWPAVAGRAGSLEVDGVSVNVLDLDALIESKRAGTRTKDREAVELLERLRGRP